MKKFFILCMAAVIAIFLPSCQVKDDQIKDPVSFSPTTAYLYPSKMNEKYDWKTSISLYGSIINNQIKVESCNVDYVVTANGDRLLVTDSYWTRLRESEGKQDFILNLNSDQLVQKETVITGVGIKTNYGTQEYQIGEYHIKPTDYTELRYGFIYENPVDLLDTASQDMILTYIAAVPTIHDTISFQAKLPNAGDKISVSVEGWEINEQATKELQDIYFGMTPYVQDLKAYTIHIRVKANTRDAVIQPVIQARYHNFDFYYDTDPIRICPAETSKPKRYQIKENNLREQEVSVPIGIFFENREYPDIRTLPSVTMENGIQDLPDYTHPVEQGRDFQIELENNYRFAIPYGVAARFQIRYKQHSAKLPGQGDNWGNPFDEQLCVRRYYLWWDDDPVKPENPAIWSV